MISHANSRMYSEDWTARAEAYAEAANHLELHWTDDRREMKQGHRLAELFRNEAVKCHSKADATPSIAMSR